MKYIPNIITLANLLCGCLSIVFATIEVNLILAGLFIFFAAVLDFCDGFAARLLNAYSAIGKELDSLADMVSFGVAPAMIAFRYIFAQADKLPFEELAYLAFAMTLFSALRLAKFNIDTRQSENFIGMPTPANAMFWASLPLVLQDLNEKVLGHIAEVAFHPLLLLVLCVLFCAFLVMPIPMLSFKFKTTAFKPNWQRFTLAWLVLGLYFIIGISAIPLGILIYPLFSLTLLRK